MPKKRTGSKPGQTRQPGTPAGRYKIKTAVARRKRPASGGRKK